MTPCPRCNAKLYPSETRCINCGATFSDPAHTQLLRDILSAVKPAAPDVTISKAKPESAVPKAIRQRETRS